MAMICDHQSKKLPSCVARQMAMIYFEKSNIPNASETNRCSCNGKHLIESFDYKGLQPVGGTQFCQRNGHSLVPFYGEQLYETANFVLRF